ncbi:SET domain-containing protein 4-like [Clytia hemisphaerica]|uniref:SET domain-containing protein n=1 Tax=Clytia hemisphaerica TaxID=252671 RepID=A0A7M5WKF7_9CNID
MNSSIKELFIWSLNNGVQIRGLTIKDFPLSGRGVMTTRHINKNDLIIKIARRFLITFDTVLTSMKWCIRDESNHGLTAKDLFLFFILVEKWKGKASKFRIYIESIPETYTTPSCIPESKASLLPDFVSLERNKQRAKIAGHFKRLTHFLTAYQSKMKEKRLNFDDVMWAWNVVNTRSVYLNPRNLTCSLDAFTKLSEVDFALAPLLDMLNHESGAQVEAKFNTKSNHYEIRTFDSYEPKEQVFINYGSHGNRMLFFEYGFILPNNIHAVCPISRHLFLIHFPMNSQCQDSELLKIGISLEKMNCTREGYFNWAFINAAHILFEQHSPDIRKLPSQCVGGRCKVYERVLNLIHDLEKFYDNHLSKLRNEQNGALRQVFYLLENERNILYLAKEKWTTDCQIMLS